jgi:hypothetical protein
MFSQPQKKSEAHKKLDNYSVELAMFMRWCETCGSGALSSVRCVEVAEGILAREGFEKPEYKSLYVASIAATLTKYDVDQCRIRTFDGAVKSFCAILGIELPYEKASPTPKSAIRPNTGVEQAEREFLS